MSPPLVILTASIDPRGCAFLRRADPAVRMRDYVDSLRSWIATSYPLLLVENSGHPADPLFELAADHPDRVEVLQFQGNRYPRELGKGFGEMEILRHALERSVSIHRHDRLAKVTGRIFVENFAEIAARPGLQHQPGGRTEVFVCDREFLASLVAFQGWLDDSHGRIFETAFREARRSRPFQQMDPAPVLRGYSGTFDTPYSAGPLWSFG